MDPRGLGEFIVCGCVLENRSLFSGISGSSAGLGLGFPWRKTGKKASYFRAARMEEQERLEPEAYYTQLRDVFVRNLPRYFNGKERGRGLADWWVRHADYLGWHKAEPNSLPCYTYGSLYRDNQDVQLARRVAKIYGQQHQVITTGAEFLNKFAHYARALPYILRTHAWTLIARRIFT